MTKYNLKTVIAKRMWHLLQGGIFMSSVSGINITASAYAEYVQPEKKTEDTAKKTDDTAVVYEKSTTKDADRTAIINQMKADQEKHMQTLQDLVSKMMGQQANAFGAATDMWKFLASGNFEVDAATKAQAQEDISEDGYWGVEQTSERILDFAKALSGGDTSKAEMLKDAFIKGYKQAMGEWGKDLPEISQKTYDKVMEKFDKWVNEGTDSTAVAE